MSECTSTGAECTAIQVEWKFLKDRTAKRQPGDEEGEMTVLLTLHYSLHSSGWFNASAQITLSTDGTQHAWSKRLNHPFCHSQRPGVLLTGPFSNTFLLPRVCAFFNSRFWFSLCKISPIAFSFFHRLHFHRHFFPAALFHAIGILLLPA